MQRKSLIQTVMALAIVSLASTALAASVHFKRTPTFTDNGTTLTANGALAGLGNGDITITVTARGLISTTGVNPGGNSAPGQNKVATAVSGTQVIPQDAIKNGNVSFSVTTGVPPTPTAKQAGFPNNNWTVTISNVVFTSVTVTVTQGGQTVLSQTFTL